MRVARHWCSALLNGVRFGNPSDNAPFALLFWIWIIWIRDLYARRKHQKHLISVIFSLACMHRPTPWFARLIRHSTIVTTTSLSHPRCRQWLWGHGLFFFLFVGTCYGFPPQGSMEPHRGVTKPKPILFFFFDFDFDFDFEKHSRLGMMRSLMRRILPIDIIRTR